MKDETEEILIGAGLIYTALCIIAGTILLLLYFAWLAGYLEVDVHFIKHR